MVLLENESSYLFTFAPLCSRLNLIYLTLILHGVGTLMPWNMFITAKEVRVVSISSKNMYVFAKHLAKQSVFTLHSIV